jgi:hypothetical protein
MGAEVSCARSNGEETTAVMSRPAKDSATRSAIFTPRVDR